jgi:predicted small lipoprotein YifL
MKTHLLLATTAVTLAACGQSGDLYLPEPKQGTVITRPAAPAPATPAPATPSPDTLPNNSPGTVDSPSRPVPPAPEVSAPAEKKDGKKPKNR